MDASSTLRPIEDVGKAFNQAPDSEKRWQSSKHKWSHVGHTPTIASYLEVSQMHLSWKQEVELDDGLGMMSV